MRLVEFRLQGFRSVEDSGPVHLASDITILAGKNESGKSALLDGLASLLSTKETDLSGDRTLDYTERPQLEARFEASDEQIRTLCDKIGLEYPDINPAARDIRVLSTEDTLNWENSLFDQILEEVGQLERRLIEICSLILGEDLSDVDFSEQADELIERCRKVQNRSDEHPDESETDEDSLLEQNMAELERLYTSWKDYCMKEDEAREVLSSFLPPVIHFSSFDDQLPDQISLSDDEARGQKIVRDFCTLTNLDLNKLANAEDSFTRQHLVENARDFYSREFGKFWRQEALRIGPAVDGDKLLFTVRAVEEKNSYRPSQRSRGLRWYTSFFIALTARREQADAGIILIDEPGLYLHAKAQEEVVGVLENLCTSGYQVIIGTHSPYLMQAERLDRIRLVIKDEKTKRTRVHPAWYSGADRETLTPVLTAIGVDGLRTFPGLSRWNVVVEGPTDYYYLQAMKHWFDQQDERLLRDDIAFVPCLGHTNAGLMVSLLVGWARECVVVLDRKGTQRTAERLVDQGLAPERILRLGADENESAFDLFSRQDQRELLGQVQPINSGNQPASQLVKKIGGTSETIIARQFLDKILRGEYTKFTQQTLANFRREFTAIEKAFVGMATTGVAVGIEEESVRAEIVSG